MNWRADIRGEFIRLGRTVDDDVVEELAQHAAADWAARRAEGATIAEADAAVRTLLAEWCRGAAPVHRQPRPALIESASAGSPFVGLGLDIRHALRRLARQPAFAVASVLLLTLGISATTAVFSVVNGVLLRPLPWPNAGRVVRLSEGREGGTVNTRAVFSNATYLAWRSQATTIDVIAGSSTTTVTLDGPDGAERIPAARATASLFSVLGVSPAIGAGFTEAQDEQPLAIISDGFWRERFGATPDIVGRTLTLASGTVTIVGVMPAGFQFPSPDTRLWLPAHIPQAIHPEGGVSISLFDGLALLKPGVTAARAAEEGQRIARTLPDLGPVIPAVFGSNGPATVSAMPLAQALTGDVRPVLWMLLVAVALLWLAAIGNIASMQLAHAVRQRREVAIRAAIGAGAGRIARQLLVENAVLALCGGTLGLGLAASLLRALPAWLPADFPRADALTIDARVMIVAVVLTCIASAAIAILPIRLAVSLNLRNAVSNDDSLGGLFGWRRGALRSRYLIVVVQVAIATVLLVCGGLLGRSFLNLWRLDRGFDTANVLTARVQLPASRASAALRTEAFETILARVRQFPGVREAGLADDIPLGGAERRFASTVAEDGQPPRTVSALLRQVTPGYFNAMGFRLLAGRGFTDADTFTSEPVVVVNRTFARKYLGAQPVGEWLTAGIDSKRNNVLKWRVVGVLDDALRANATDPVQPEVFVSPKQMLDGPTASGFIVIRGTTDASALATALRSALRGAEPRATMDQVLTMTARLARSLARPRLYAALFSGFALFAALVAIVGVFGGVSYSVSQRDREIGVRSALGASPSDIVWMFLRQGAGLTLAGLAVGAVGAMFVARVLSGQFFGVTARDPMSYLVVGAGIVVVALVASLLPARRAARVDPLRVLKS